MFQDTKGVTRRKRTNNDLQNITQKTKDRATRAPLKTGVNCPFSFALSVPSSTDGFRRWLIFEKLRGIKHTHTTMTNIDVNIIDKQL